MHNELLEYVRQFVELTEEEARVIVEEIAVETFPKGTVLLQAGEISQTCYFILKGCVRQFQLVEGEEKTTGFFTEKEAVVAFTSYSQQVPAVHCFVCAEETTAVVGSMDQEAEMYARFPKFEAISRLFMSHDFGKAQETMAAFITSSPEERYRHLLHTRPDLFQRVPQHQIASYLGITPESLSRIRRRILR